MGEKDGDEKEYVTSAPPPVHSVATLILLLAIFVPNFPSLEELDKVATPETFTRRVFPELLSLDGLIYARIVITIILLLVTFYTLLSKDGGWQQATNYLPQTKLRQSVIDMTGIRTQLPFTSWSWNILTLSFALNAYIAWATRNKLPLHPWLLRGALLLFETAAPYAILVSFVVRYAIWPQVLKSTGDTSGLRHPRTLMWHNANAVFGLLEAAMMGGIPVCMSHIATSPIIGIFYVFFTWAAMHYWKPQAGPQFIYFFFDTTLGATTTIALLALLMALMTFYGMFSIVATTMLDYAADFTPSSVGGRIAAHAIFTLMILGLVCRFRDY